MTKKKENKAKLGARAVAKKNPYLKKNGSLNLVEKFVGIDYMPYEKRIKKSKKR